jgi:hypothetical protein
MLQVPFNWYDKLNDISINVQINMLFLLASNAIVERAIYSDNSYDILYKTAPSSLPTRFFHNREDKNS